MSEVEKLVKKALIQNFFEGYRCDDPRSAQTVVAALIAAGVLKTSAETKL